MEAKDIANELRQQIKFYAYAVDDDGNKAPIHKDVANLNVAKILNGSLKPATEEGFLKKFGYFKVSERQYTKADHSKASQEAIIVMASISSRICQAIAAGADVSIESKPHRMVPDYDKQAGGLDLQKPVGTVITITIPEHA